uniref:Uncharacterized protein n=1 Tax=Setaria italica TaxID=4555 RepID=K3YDD6_SETIT
STHSPAVLLPASVELLPNGGACLTGPADRPDSGIRSTPFSSPAQAMLLPVAALARCFGGGSDGEASREDAGEERRVRRRGVARGAVAPVRVAVGSLGGGGGRREGRRRWAEWRRGAGQEGGWEREGAINEGAAAAAAAARRARRWFPSRAAVSAPHPVRRWPHPTCRCRPSRAGRTPSLRPASVPPPLGLARIAAAQRRARPAPPSPARDRDPIGRTMAAAYRRLLLLRRIPHPQFQPAAATYCLSPTAAAAAALVKPSSPSAAERIETPLSTLRPGFTSDSNFKYGWHCKLGSSVGAVLIGQAAFFLGLSNGYAFAQEDSVSPAATSEQAEVNATGLQRIEDGSVVSNEHTVKWRIFTDNGRDFFQKANLAGGDLSPPVPRTDPAADRGGGRCGSSSERRESSRAAVARSSRRARTVAREAWRLERQQARAAAARARAAARRGLRLGSASAGGQRPAAGGMWAARSRGLTGSHGRLQWLQETTGHRRHRRAGRGPRGRRGSGGRRGAGTPKQHQGLLSYLLPPLGHEQCAVPQGGDRGAVG